jgi:hypothetical protein
MADTTLAPKEKSKVALARFGSSGMVIHSDHIFGRAITTVGNDGLNANDSRERRSKPMVRLAKHLESA